MELQYSIKKYKIPYMEPKYTTNINKIIGEKIIAIRKKKGLTQEKLAYENDIPKSTISRIEQGIVDARISNLERIANGLDIKLFELLR